MSTDNVVSDKTSAGSMHKVVWIAMFGAVIAIGAFANIPIGPVPISLQTMFVLMAGLVLGPVGGMLAVLLYLAAGLVGLPVFTGGQSGLGRLFGPTGGFLIGFIFCALIAGLVRLFQRDRLSWLLGLTFGLLGFAALYGLGLYWLKTKMQMDWAKAMVVGILPFLPGDVVKLVIAVACSRFLIKNRLTPA